MKHIRMNRLVIFVTRDRYNWLGWSLQWDYRNIIGTVVFMTLEVGFEYVREGYDERMEKRGCGWSIWRFPT